jgi:hypothetical protein
MKDIKRRLERLEQATMPDEDRECLVILCKAWARGRLTALMINRGTDDELRLPRLEDETEQAFYDRAEAKMKEMRPCRIDGGKAIYMMTEDREPSAEETEYMERYDRKQAENRAAAVRIDTPGETAKPREDEAPDPPEPRRPYVPERTPKQVIEIKRQEGPTAGHWLLG